MYSVLWFCPEFKLNQINQLKAYLHEGTKVFFLTYEDIEVLQKEDFLREALEKGLLYSYMVKYSDQWDKEMILYNGNVEETLLVFLDQYSSFNKEQYILEHAAIKGHSIVKAGAGTGKTTTMINRILFLKSTVEDLHLNTVAMITFTNDAAIHMRSKLLEKIKNYYDITKNQMYLEWMEEIGEMFIGTIHAFARQFLSSEGSKLGFDQTIKIRSFLHDRKRLVEKYIDEFSVLHFEIYEKFKLLPHYKLVKAMIDILERIDNKSISFEEVLQMDFGTDSREFSTFVEFVIQKVLVELENKKITEEALEISDLISRLRSLRNISKEELSLTIKYLFVDEFQDTDEAQVSFVSWITEHYDSQMLAVGDVKQSIYRFRGADYTAFNQLKIQLSSRGQLYSEYSLKKNYRSEKQLIQQFNALFEKWGERVNKFHFDETDKLIPVIDDQDKSGIVAVKFDSINLTQILRRLYQKDVAVLVRSNRQVSIVVDEIESLGFFCDATVSGAFYRSLPVREFYLLLRYFSHPNVPKDQYLFHCSSYGKQTLTVKDILNEFSPEKITILDQIKASEKIIETLNKKVSTIAALQKIIEEIKPYDVFRIRYFQSLRQKFPHVDKNMHKKESIARMEEYKANLDRLIFLLKQQFGDFQASLYDLEKFLSIKMATDNTENEWKKEEDVSHRIKVMTVHKAKGLEFDFVLMPETSSAFIKNSKTQVLLIQDRESWKLGFSVNWIDQQLINSHFEKNITDEKEEIVAEESRLLYVALTRAKKGIFVNSSPNMSRQSFQSWNDLLESGELLNV